MLLDMQLIYGTIEYLQSGGLVVIPLILVSLWLWLLIGQKSLEFRRLRRIQKSVTACVSNKDDPEFQSAPWQKAVLEQFFAYQDIGIRPRQKLLKRVSQPYELAVDKNIQTILVLAGLTPLLGLLGTVMGMITTFDVIADYGTGNSKAMASGISQALITTQTGLVVAVPGLFVGNILKRRAMRIKEQISSFCMSLIKEYSVQSDPGQALTDAEAPDANAAVDESEASPET